MSKNKAGSNIIKEVGKMQQGLNIQQTNYWRGRHRVVMLQNDVATSQLTFTNTSDVTWTDSDLSGYTSSGTSDISDNSIAVILSLRMRDTGSAATATTFQVRPNGSTNTVGVVVAAGGHINDQWGYANGIVLLDENFLIEYMVDASGASTADTEGYIIGYIERLK